MYPLPRHNWGSCNSPTDAISEHFTKKFITDEIQLCLFAKCPAHILGILPGTWRQRELVQQEEEGATSKNGKSFIFSRVLSSYSLRNLHTQCIGLLDMKIHYLWLSSNCRSWNSFLPTRNEQVRRDEIIIIIENYVCAVHMVYAPGVYRHIPHVVSQTKSKKFAFDQTVPLIKLKRNMIIPPWHVMYK